MRNRTSVVLGNEVSHLLRDGAYVIDPVLVDSGATFTPGIFERSGPRRAQYFEE